jgi:hypothetical protein
VIRLGDEIKAHAAATNKPNTIALNASRSRIFAEGQFEPGTVKLFEEFVQQNGLTDSAASSVTVVLDSPGGTLGSGIGLGVRIRKFGFNTAVGFTTGGSFAVEPGRCLSACAIAFLGGKQRSLSPKDQLGV